MMMTLVLLITMQTLQQILSLLNTKSSITGKTSNANQENGENTERGNRKIKKNLEIVVPLKYLNHFWRSLDIPLINCELPLTLTWSENCVLTDIKIQTARNADPNADPLVEARERIDAQRKATFKITELAKLCPSCYFINKR